MSEILKHTVEPTIEFWLNEGVKCKDDLLYYYNNYWTIDGKSVTPIGREEWDFMNYHPLSFERWRRR